MAQPEWGVSVEHGLCSNVAGVRTGRWHWKAALEPLVMGIFAWCVLQVHRCAQHTCRIPLWLVGRAGHIFRCMIPAPPFPQTRNPCTSTQWYSRGVSVRFHCAPRWSLYTKKTSALHLNISDPLLSPTYMHGPLAWQVLPTVNSDASVAGQVVQLPTAGPPEADARDVADVQQRMAAMEHKLDQVA